MCNFQRIQTLEFVYDEQLTNLLLSAGQRLYVFPLFLAGNYSNKLLIVTLLLLAGDVEVNPGPGGSSFPCGLCDIDANWSNGGIVMYGTIEIVLA